MKDVEQKVIDDLWAAVARIERKYKVYMEVNLDRIVSMLKVYKVKNGNKKRAAARL